MVEMSAESSAHVRNLGIRVPSLQQMCGSKFIMSALTERAQLVLFCKGPALACQWNN